MPELFPQQLKANFTPDQQDYYLQLENELDEIKGGRTEEEIITVQDFKTLQRVIDKKQEMLNFVLTKKTREMVRQEKPYSFNETGEQRISLESYDSVTSPINVNGQMVFVGRKNDRYYVVGYQGEIIGEKNGYGRVGYLNEINNNLYFHAEINGRWFLLENGTKIIGDQQGYDKIEISKKILGRVIFEVYQEKKNMTLIDNTGKVYGEPNSYRQVEYHDFGDKMIMVASKNNRGVIISQEGEIISPKIGFDHDPFLSSFKTHNVNGQLLFRIERNGLRYLLNEQGQIVMSLTEYASNGDPLICDGKLLVPCMKRKKDHVKWHIVDQQGQKIGDKKGYDELRGYSQGDKILFFARIKNNYYVLNAQGEIVHKTFEPITNIHILGDKYFVQVLGNHGDSWMRDKNGKLIGRELGNYFDAVISPQKIGNEIYFIALRNERLFVVNEKMEIIGDSDGFEKIFSIDDVDGKLFYRAIKNYRYFLVDENGELIGDHAGYEKIEKPKQVGDQVVFVVKKNNVLIVVNEFGVPISDEYMRIFEIIEKNGEAYVMAKSFNSEYVMQKLK